MGSLLSLVGTKTGKPIWRAKDTHTGNQQFYFQLRVETLTLVIQEDTYKNISNNTVVKSKKIENLNIHQKTKNCKL